MTAPDPTVCPTCPVCDHDDHRCPKCGRSVEHGAITCDDLDCIETPEESVAIVDHNLRAKGMAGLAPTVCPTCEGNEEVGSLVRDHDGAVIEILFLPCPDCCCEVCGEPTPTPPLCETHQRENDDAAATKAWREGRYE